MNTFSKISCAAVVAASVVATAPAAFAASATATASFDGILDIRTTGSASAVLTGFDFLFSNGVTTGGIDDLLNDGVTFYSQVSPLGEGTAANAGPAGGSATAIASDASASFAGTLSNLGMLIGGTGMIEIDFGYSLAVDVFDILPVGGAIAAVEASIPFGGAETVFISLVGAPGPGDSLFDGGIFTLSFFVDIASGLGALPTLLTVTTYAMAESAPVPVPAAVWLLGSALIGVAGISRRRAAA